MGGRNPQLRRRGLSQRGPGGNKHDINLTTDGVRKYGLNIGSTGNFPGGGGASTVNYGLHSYVTGADLNYPGVFMGGNVGIGTDTPLDPLQVLGNIRVGTSGTNGCVKRFDGTAIAGACSSDARLKTDVQPLQPVLNQLAQLTPVHFSWKADEFPEMHFGRERSYGLIAQEVEKLFPEMVGQDERGYKTVDYTRLPLLLLQAVRELKAENELLQQVDRELKSENTRLREQMQSQLRAQAAELENLKAELAEGRAVLRAVERQLSAAGLASRVQQASDRRAAAPPAGGGR
ncbi:MAG: tail fiber domain-containing protein [Acidobacteriia bacterium]|nr:tail fiber domain-containing protein [Terriglobia bacterium]